MQKYPDPIARLRLLGTVLALYLQFQVKYADPLVIAGRHKFPHRRNELNHRVPFRLTDMSLGIGEVDGLHDSLADANPVGGSGDYGRAPIGPPCAPST